MVQHLAIYATEAEQKQPFGAHDRDSAWQGRCFDPRAIVTPHSPQVGTNPTHQLWQTNRYDRMARKVSDYSKKRIRPLFHWQIGPKEPSARRDSLRGTKLDKKFQSLAFPFSLRIALSFLRVCTMAKSSTIQTGKPGYIAAQRGYRLG
jgi:hypothetical protein